MSFVRLPDSVSRQPNNGLLLERERELSTIEGALGDAAAGRGTVALIEGPPGIGKTALLRAARRLAGNRSFTVLNARGTPLEAAFSFGVVRQLFEPLRLDANKEPPSELLSGAAELSMNALGPQQISSGMASEDAFFATLHGLYWLTANLSFRAPLLVVVDDCQWADSPSLRFLAHVGARLDGLPLVLLLGLRVGHSGADAELLAQLVSLSAGEPIRPGALGPKSAARLVRTELGSSATDRFCAACLDATGGNPLLLRTLVSSIAAEGVEPSDQSAALVTTFGIESVARLLSSQLAQLDKGAEPVARALSVLGGGAALRHVAKLTGIELDRAALIVDSLREASILSPGRDLDFAHPILRVAVYDGIGRDACGLAHAKAAELLASEGAPPDRIALHLLHAQPRGDAAVVEIMRAAARVAEDRGAPDTAAAYLARALEEPPSSSARGELLLELGVALMAAGLDPQAVGPLREAVELVPSPEDRLRAALLGGRSLGIAGYFDTAAGLLELALDEVGRQDSELTLLVEAELIANSWHIADRVPSALQRLADYRDTEAVDGAARSLMLVMLAFRSLVLGERAETARDLLKRAVDDEQIFQQESIVVIFAIMGLIWVDELDISEQICSEFVREIQRRGSASQASHVFPRALICLRRGWLRDAEADARWALEQKLSMGRRDGSTWAWGYLVDALVERGDFEAAERALAQSDFPTDPPETMGWANMLEARGRLRVAQNRVSEGLADLLDVGKRWERLGWRGSLSSTWRGDAALALALIDDVDEARHLAAEQLELARASGLPRLIGTATRVAGTVAPRDESVALLAEAVDLLEKTPARLELGRALVELGAALRRVGRRSAAREKLRQGLELAHRSGAAQLASRARDELIAAGGRPRRPFLTGVEALTASELRVARLAAQGMTNREIAERLFVTQRTVETHLHHAFQKLGISGRDNLPRELATPVNV